MGLFSNLISRLTGNTSKRIEANPDYQSPYTIAQRATALPGQRPAVFSQIEAVKGGFQPVISSNVAGIRWFPGAAKFGELAPGMPNMPGPAGGAPVMGGTKIGGAVTKQVPIAFSGVAEQDVKPSTLGTLEVMFRPSGRRGTSVYQYYDVPKSMYDEMYASSSKGRFVYYRLRHWPRQRRVR